ncbi:MAG: hypothetical protein KBC06_00690 [Candidatus Pacebacteria bacterium]|nr:hypothetical protein [Candidatus Paceibacterota bacterium]
MINIAYAASGNLDSFIMKINKLIVNPIITLLFALALVYFLYGVFQFISNGDNEEAKTTGKMHMVWGIIGLTIMMGVFAIMNLILNTLKVDGITPETGKVELDGYNPTYPPR